jgi:uncharacterized membrane protein YtjA (UPF0391 family)
MSRFEFIFVLISIVAGLALTRLLSGLTQSLKRSERGIDIAHVLFSLGIVVLLFSIWWNAFRWEDHDVWTFLEYSLLCVYMSMFYAMAAILHPLNSPVVPRFDEIRTPFYLAFILYQFVELPVVYVRDGIVAWEYLTMVIHLNVLAGIGIYLRKSKFDQLLAAWLLFNYFAFQFASRLMG